MPPAIETFKFASVILSATSELHSKLFQFVICFCVYVCSHRFGLTIREVNDAEQNDIVRGKPKDVTNLQECSIQILKKINWCCGSVQWNYYKLLLSKKDHKIFYLATCKVEKCI